MGKPQARPGCSQHEDPRVCAPELDAVDPCSLRRSPHKRRKHDALAQPETRLREGRGRPFRSVSDARSSVVWTRTALAGAGSRARAGVARLGRPGLRNAGRPVCGRARQKGRRNGDASHERDSGRDPKRRREPAAFPRRGLGELFGRRRVEGRGGRDLCSGALAPPGRARIRKQGACPACKLGIDQRQLRRDDRQSHRTSVEPGPDGSATNPGGACWPASPHGSRRRRWCGRRP
jgi:hypothetical protein